MINSRRVFIRDLSLASIAALTIPYLFSRCTSDKGLNILVLGGTNFLGPAIVNALSDTGHNITLFNRGITNPHLFPELKKIKGDREKGLSGYKNLQIDNDKWDIVIDVWPNNPTMVQDAIDILKDKTNHYLFVSSIAVYHNYVTIGIDETASLRKGSKYEPGNYNLNKTLCEKVVETNFPNRFTILRPGAIVGDRDSGPFGTYVLNRIMNRSEILAPDSNDPVQFIDASDIGNFVSKCVANRIYGHFNLVGPRKTIGYKDLLTRAKKALNSNVNIIWMEPNFLIKEMKLEPFMEIPFWIPLESDPEPGFQQISNKKALNVGLEFTEYEDTVKISYESFKENRFILEEGSDLVFGITNERENEIIKQWKEIS